MPAHEDALALVNTIKVQAAFLARAIVRALNDDKVSSLEWLMIGSQGTTFAATLLTTLQGQTPEMRKEVLYVLEHATLALEEGGSPP